MKILQSGKSLDRSVILPRPARSHLDIAPDQPFVIAGMFRAGSGLGRAALSCFEALRAEGYSPLAADLSAAFNQVDLSQAVALAPFEKRPPRYSGHPCKPART